MRHVNVMNAAQIKIKSAATNFEKYARDEAQNPSNATSFDEDFRQSLDAGHMKKFTRDTSMQLYSMELYPCEMAFYWRRNTIDLLYRSRHFTP